MSIPIEDNYEDIVGKAVSGLGLTAEATGRKAGVSEANVQAAMDGYFDENIAHAIAPVLDLDVTALIASGKKQWLPTVPEVIGLQMFTSHFAFMLVNAFVAWDPASKVGVVFDTGAEADQMLAFIEAQQLDIPLVLLTHAHNDHIVELDRVLAATGADAFIASDEPVPQAATFSWGDSFSAGGLEIETRKTVGHSPGGTSYVISGLAQKVAIVGDAVFAGSMGGGRFSYQQALDCNRAEIMTLPDETILCPGHGPMTTVGQERQFNPFLATGNA